MINLGSAHVGRLWHVVDVRAIWVREFAAALAQQVEVIGWLPKVSWLGALRRGERLVGTDRGLSLREFPLQRGFADPPVCWVLNEGSRLARRLQAAGPSDAVLVLTAPHYFRLARCWPGPTVYYATDMFRFWWGERERERIERLERAICDAVNLVCPNSRRIADYMAEELGVPRQKIVILPNATRAENVLPVCPERPFALPGDAADLPRPVAGVVGNLAANTDWELLERVVHDTPWLSWLFVGPTDMPVPESPQERARRALMRAGGRVRFVGPKPYSVLREYARALDVAVLPYRKREPTYSGSSTRFYEHLAACRPMLATRGSEELLHKEPLLRLVDGPGHMVSALEELRSKGFRDGHEQERWRASQSETWEARATTMLTALAARRRRPAPSPIYAGEGSDE